MSFSVTDHQNSKRVRVIKFKESDLDRLVFPFKKHTIVSLEYKPFSRFSLAKSLDEVFNNSLSKELTKILNDRQTGTVVVEPEMNNKKFDKDFEYIKKWIPNYNSKNYIEPIVNHKDARALCLKIYKEALN